MAHAVMAPPGRGVGVSTNDWTLFSASFLTLIAAGIGFSVRGAILGDWGRQYGFTQSELGTITGGGLIGFGVTIIVLSFVADRIGYGRLMGLAFLLHAASAVVTFAATPVFNAYGKDAAYNCLYTGMWLFALGNGTCEAVINPLTATLFPRNKTHWLNILHAGWPLGLILGALIVLGFNFVGGLGVAVPWEAKLGVFLVPVVIYGLLMLGKRFPTSEAAASGVTVGNMMGQVGLLGFAVVTFFLGYLLSDQLPGITKYFFNTEVPGWAGWVIALGVWAAFGGMSGFALGSALLAVLYILHALVGYVELGTDSWIVNITDTVLQNPTFALVAFIWTNALMFVLRFFAGPIVHQINPLGLLLGSAALGTAGLYLMGLDVSNSWPVWLVAVTIYGIGKTFYWPTMLGVVSEQFPRGGALALGIAGGIGMISAGAFGGPGIGYKQDYYAINNLTATAEGKDTYARYKADATKGFPLATELANTPPKVAGLDGAKVGVLLDDGKQLATDLENLRAKNVRNEATEQLQEWWNSTGKPNAAKDKPLIEHARLTGGKSALTATAVVPAILAVGYLLLIGYFAATGGYKQIHLDGAYDADPAPHQA